MSIPKIVLANPGDIAKVQALQAGDPKALAAEKARKLVAEAGLNELTPIVEVLERMSGEVQGAVAAAKYNRKKALKRLADLALSILQVAPQVRKRMAELQAVAYS